MSVDTVETTDTEKAPRVKRSPAELKAARVEKAQKRLDAIKARGEKVQARATATAERAAKAKAKADAYGEELAFAEASLKHEQSRPVKGEGALTGDEDDPFVEDSQPSLFDDVEDDEDEDADLDVDDDI